MLVWLVLQVMLTLQVELVIFEQQKNNFYHSVAKSTSLLWHYPFNRNL